MSFSLNKAMLIGRVGADPERKVSRNGAEYAKFSVATNTKYRNKETKEKEDRTQWHNIFAYGKLSDICMQYLKKGDPVYVEGTMNQYKYTAKDSSDEKYYSYISCTNLQMLSQKDSDSRKSTITEPYVKDNFKAEESDDIPF